MSFFIILLNRNLSSRGIPKNSGKIPAKFQKKDLSCKIRLYFFIFSDDFIKQTDYTDCINPDGYIAKKTILYSFQGR